MTRLYRSVTACLAFLLVTFAIAGTSNADTYDHIDRMAIDIQRKARLLMRETVHYRNTPNYRQLLVETNKLYQLASHIHNVTHFAGQLRHLESDLRDLNRCFQRLERLFDATEYQAQYGHGRVRGCTAHVKQLLNAVEDCILNMQDDVATLRRLVRHNYRQRPTFQNVIPPAYTVPPTFSAYQRLGYTTNRVGFPTNSCPSSRNSLNQRYSRSANGIGFSIGGGNSRIDFRF